MPAERWRRIEDIYEAAPACPADERPAFLARVCAGDPALRDEPSCIARRPSRPSAIGQRTTPALRDYDRCSSRSLRSLKHHLEDTP